MLHVGASSRYTPSQAIVLLERQNVTSQQGTSPYRSKSGRSVKLHSRVSVVYGMITGLRVPLPSPEPSDKDLKLVELELGRRDPDADGSDGLSSGAACLRIRRWTSPYTVPQPLISRKFMRGPARRPLGSGRSIRQCRARLCADR